MNAHGLNYQRLVFTMASLGLALCFCFSLRAETILLQGATVHTVSGKVLSPGDVLIEDGKIKDVKEKIEGGAQTVINLRGKHLFPGLIAANTTLGLVEIAAVRATRDENEVGEYTPEVQGWTAVNPDSQLLPVARANGITHISPVPGGGIVAGQSGVVALDGWTVEQMAIKKPVALHLFWPSMDLNTLPKERFRKKEDWKSLEDQAKERAAKLKELDDFFSEAEAYAKQLEQSKTPAQVVPAWEAMLPFVKGQFPVVIHADELRQIKAAVQWATVRKYKIILAGGRDAWQLAELLAKEKIPVIYERTFNGGDGLAATSARDVDAYDTYFRAPSILHKAGVKVIFAEGRGGDGAAHIRNLPYSAAQAVAFGLPEEEGIKGITLYPAEILGVADRLGSIEPGKEASLVALDGNILDIRAHVTDIWINGKKLSLDTRHTRLHDKYRNRPKAP